MTRNTVLALVLFAAACGGASSPSPPVVVVIQDGAVPDAREIVSPAVLALEQALEAGGVEIRVVESRNAETVVGDPSVIAVVVAPFATISPSAQQRLLDAGLAVVSLSSISATPASPSAWRRLVSSVDREAATLASLIPGDVPCAAGEETVWSSALSTALRAAEPSMLVFQGAPAEVVAAVVAEGCGGVVWTGSAAGAADLVEGLGRGMPVALGSAARTAGFVERAWPASEGTAGVCGCADLTTSADAPAQAFVHDYQAATGLDPGPFAVEATDAAALLLGVEEAPATRTAVAARVEGTTELRGLGGAYAWASSGELLTPDVRIYGARGVRWLLAEPPP